MNESYFCTTITIVPGLSVARPDTLQSFLQTALLGRSLLVYFSACYPVFFTLNCCASQYLVIESAAYLDQSYLLDQPTLLFTYVHATCSDFT
jgi:hypothetical protein